MTRRPPGPRGSNNQVDAKADAARAERQASRQARAAAAKKAREPKTDESGQPLGLRLAATADSPGGRARLRQTTHERLGLRGLSPRKALGQNFLVSDHVMNQIQEFAAITPDDVVLEVGGGLGVLSERIAETAKHLHIIELDDQLADLLEELLAPLPVTVHRGDAVKFDLSTLDPPPNALIANLPYGVAATVVLRAVHEMPTVDRWLVMVQKEVGERFAARPGTKTYGVPSALAQLSCSVKLRKSVPRSAFLPAPHVDSVLMSLTRTGPPAEPGIRRLIQAGFAHRRKALTRSLAITIGDPNIREAAREALVDLGIREDARAEQLSSDQFRALYAVLVAKGIGGLK